MNNSLRHKLWLAHKKLRNIKRMMTTDHLNNWELAEYWKYPDDASNSTDEYIIHPERSIRLCEIMSKYVDRRSSILELGCNVGRNLYYLNQSGYNSLTGVEISEMALKVSKEHYPTLNANLVCSDIYDYIETIKDNSFDCIFVMAVFQHLPDEDIFEDIVKKTNDVLIVIEDEKSYSQRHFPRNYKKVFEDLGLKQIYFEKWDNYPGVDCWHICRVFKKIKENKKNEMSP